MNPASENQPPDISGAVFLIDGNSLAYRAFYALPETIATSGGLPTNALYGFATMLVKILTDYEPAGVVVAWDAGKKVFRHADFEDYKAHRKPMPDNLSLQFGHFDELVAAFGFESLKKEGYEADDILATLAREARDQRQKAVIVTADRDALQLVDNNVYVMSNTKGISEVKVYDPAAVEARYGISPARVPDFIGLKGDTSDNIPGVPGIGDKTAAALLQQYDSLPEIFDHIDDIKGKRRQLLEEHREQALLSRELATMNDEVPLPITADTIRPRQLDTARLREVLARFEFNALLRRLEEIGMVAPEAGETLTLEVRHAAISGLAAGLARAGQAALAWEHRGDALRLAVYAGGDSVRLASGTAAEFAAVLEAAAGSAAPEPLTSPGPPAVPEPAASPGPAAPGPPAGARKVICHDFKGLLALLPSTPIACGHDTMVAAYLLKPEARTYKLDQLAAAAGIRVEVDAEQPGERALAQHAAAAFLLAPIQRRRLEEQGLARLFERVEMPLVCILAEMERAGIRVDLPRLGELASKVADQIDQLADEIRRLAGEDFNIDSPQQLAAILFEKLKLPAGKRTKKGYSTDASVLKTLRGMHGIIAKVETYRELAKLSGTYLQALPRLAGPDWRVHTTFNQTVTATGRLSSSNPNLQNIPIRTPLGEKIRDCFVAADDCRLVAADYSQVELRILAHLSGESKLRHAFAAGEDVHRDTAAEVFGLEPEEVTGKERSRAKAVNFGIMYGISAFGLAEQLDISQEEATSYITAYLARFPRVAEFRASVIAQAMKDGYVTTILGRRRPVPELLSSDGRQRSLGERLAVNTVIQGSAADIMKIAMINCHRSLASEHPGSHLVLQVHDELVFETPASAAEAVAGMARREMCAAWELEPPLEVDVGIGETWVEAK
ncbi:MAG: DNA polymerase I [Thermoleophilia bacterium]